MAKKFKFTDGNDKWEGTNKVDDVNAKGGNDKLNGMGGDDILNGAGGNDKIKGGDGNDTIKGGSGNDKINGEAGNDIVNAGSGNDKITSTSGDDTVDGGSGTDTIVLSGNFADATITKNVDGSYTIVTATGTATVSNVENFQFADGVKDADDLIIEGKDFTLTAAADTFTDLTDGGDDTITGAAGTFGTGDIIIDNTTTDADVMNLTLTAANLAASKVQGIETINVNWDSFATASFVATNISGATINLSSSKLGFLGAATVTDAGANTVTAGTGMTGALTVNGVTGATINATNSSSVTSTGSAAATDTVTINAGASTTSITSTATETVTIAAGAATTTISVGGYDTATITAGAATTGITLTDDAATDVATVTISSDVAITNAGGNGKISLNIADGKTATIDDIGLGLTVTGAGAATVSSDDFSGNTVTDSTTGTLTLISTSAGSTDFSKADADLFVLATAGQTGATLVSGDKLRADVNLGVGVIAIGGTGTADVANVTFTASQGTSTTFTGTETANITAAATAVAGADITFASLVNAGNTINLSGTNDVVITALNTKTLDASGLVGDLTVTSTAATVTDVTIAGASGINTVTFHADVTSGAFVGQGGNDVVTLGALTTVDAFTAVTGAGDDTISATISGLTTGSLSVEGGAGNDTFTLTAAGGQGTVVFQGGDGTDTLSLVAGADLTDPLLNLTVTGLEAIKVGATAAVNSSLLSGQSYTITGTGSSVITVEGPSTGATINLGSLVATDSGTTGVEFDIVGGAGNDTITGSATNDTINGGAGVDTLTGGGLADVFEFATGDTGLTVATADTITDFVTGTDDIDVSGTTITAVVDGSGFASFAALTTAANTAFAGGDDLYVAYNAVGSGDAYVLVDENANGSFDTGDTLVILKGINTALEVVTGDFV